MTTGPALRDAGVDAVLAADTAPHRGYAALVRDAVDQLGDHFTAEDVRDHIDRHHPGARAHHHNVIGGALRALAMSGRIRPNGWTSASRPQARARVLRLWVHT